MTTAALNTLLASDSTRRMAQAARAHSRRLELYSTRAHLESLRRAAKLIDTSPAVKALRTRRLIDTTPMVQALGTRRLIDTCPALKALGTRRLIDTSPIIKAVATRRLLDTSPAVNALGMRGLIDTTPITAALVQPTAARMASQLFADYVAQNRSVFERIGRDALRVDRSRTARQLAFARVGAVAVTGSMAYVEPLAPDAADLDGMDLAMLGVWLTIVAFVWAQTEDALESALAAVVAYLIFTARLPRAALRRMLRDMQGRE
jgi:hypothetical protein